MAKTRTYVHDEHTLIDSAGNEIVMYHRNTLQDVVTGVKSEVTIEGKLLFSTECNSAGDAAEKTVDVPGYALIPGSHVVVKFVNGINAADTTLNVNNTGAKPILLNGVSVPTGMIVSGNQLILKYNGTAYDIVGGAGSTLVSSDNAKKLYFIGVDDATINGTPTKEYYNTDVYINAAGNTVCAPFFQGDGSKLTSLNASEIATGTLNAQRLAASGAEPGNYGTLEDATLGFNDAFKVPKITVDRYGRVTSITDKLLTLPKNPDTDVKVTSTQNNSALYYLSGTTSEATATGTLVHNTGVYVSGNQLYANSGINAPTVYLGSASNTLTASAYTGQSATTDSISTHLEDGITSTSTVKGASANVARRLATGISTVNNSISTLIDALGTQATFSLSETTLTITTKAAPTKPGAITI